MAGLLFGALGALATWGGVAGLNEASERSSTPTPTPPAGWIFGVCLVLGGLWGLATAARRIAVLRRTPSPLAALGQGGFPSELAVTGTPPRGEHLVAALVAQPLADLERGGLRILLWGQLLPVAIGVIVAATGPGPRGWSELLPILGALGFLYELVVLLVWRSTDGEAATLRALARAGRCFPAQLGRVATTPRRRNTLVAVEWHEGTGRARQVQMFVPPGLRARFADLRAASVLVLPERAEICAVVVPGYGPVRTFAAALLPIEPLAPDAPMGVVGGAPPRPTWLDAPRPAPTRAPLWPAVVLGFLAAVWSLMLVGLGTHQKTLSGLGPENAVVGTIRSARAVTGGPRDSRSSAVLLDIAVPREAAPDGNVRLRVLAAEAPAYPVGGTARLWIVDAPFGGRSVYTETGANGLDGAQKEPAGGLIALGLVTFLVGRGAVDWAQRRRRLQRAPLMTATIAEIRPLRAGDSVGGFLSALTRGNGRRRLAPLRLAYRVEGPDSGGGPLEGFDVLYGFPGAVGDTVYVIAGRGKGHVYGWAARGASVASRL